MKKIGLVVVWALCAFVAFGDAERIRAAGPWEMARATAPEKWMPATVPGTVLTTLVKNGIVPDPYYGLNNKIEEKRIPDLSENRAFYEATFRTKVFLPSEWTKRVIWMRPEGINYRSEIYLNGKLATSTRGMFSRNAVDVSPFVRAGATNDLIVKVWPVDHPGTTKPKSWGAANGEWHNGGDGEIGRDVTMLMSAGWDFTFNDGIRDRNTGIWRDIVFFVTGVPRLKSARPQRYNLPKPDGLCGNDDCGQMSAWYLFSAMGFYPFNPCGGEYIIGAPQLPKVTLRCTPTPNTCAFFTMTAKNLSKENKYVKSVTLNGKPITGWKIRHEDIMKGGELVFEMGGKK